MELDIRADIDGRGFNEAAQRVITVEDTTTWNELMRRTLAAYGDEIDGSSDFTHLAAFVLPPTMRTEPMRGDVPNVNAALCKNIACYEQHDIEGPRDIDGRTTPIGELALGDSFWGLFDFGSTTFIRCRVEGVRVTT